MGGRPLSLKELRREHGYRTAKELADVLGINLYTLRKYEAGISRLPLELACRLADLYDCPLDVIAGRATVYESPQLAGVESQIIRSFRQASEDGRRAISAVAQSQLTEDSRAAFERGLDTARWVPSDAVSAGTYLDSLSFSTTDAAYLIILTLLERMGLTCELDSQGHHVVKAAQGESFTELDV